MNKPMMLFNDLYVGYVFPNFEFVITEEIADKYLQTIEDSTGISGNRNVNGQRLVPSTITSLFTFGGYKNFIESPTGCLHAKQEYEYLQPLYVGDKLTVGTEIVEKYTKNGRNYVVFSSGAQRGNEPVLKSKMTILWVK